MAAPFPSKRPTSVTIIGSGLAGLVLALQLARHSLPSTIYEARPSTHRESGAIVLSPNALRVLDTLGLYEALKPHGGLLESVPLFGASGAKLGMFVFGGKRFYPALRIKREIVRNELLRAVQEKQITVHYEKRLERVVEEEQGVKLQFLDGSVVSAEVVVGADGIRSTVRTCIEPGLEPFYIGVNVVYGSVAKSQMGDVDLGALVPALYLGGGGMLGILPVTAKGDYSYLCSFSSDGKGREEWAALKEDKVWVKQRLIEVFRKSGWDRDVQRLSELVEEKELILWPIFVLPELKKWMAPSKRVILIGDAAHALSPSSNQGSGMAWEDAQTLAAVLASEKSISDALEKWEAHRMEWVGRVRRYAEDVESRRKPSSSVIVRTIKELVTWILMKYYREEGLAGWIYRYNGEAAIKTIV